MQSVIHSLLDTDLYTFTMRQALLQRHPATQAEHAVVCRNVPAFPPGELIGEANAQLDHLCCLRFTADDLACPGGLRFMRSDFIDFLRIFHFQRETAPPAASASERT